MNDMAPATHSGTSRMTLPPLLDSLLRRSGRLLPGLLAALCLACVAAPPLLAAGAELPLLKSYQAFYNVPEAEKSLPHRIQFEAISYYYDSGWNLFWGETEGESFYLSLPPATHFALKPSGQKVRISGEVIPAQGLKLSKALLEPLMDVTLVPVQATGRANDSTALHKRYVEIEGYVDSQDEPDANHLRLQLIAEGWPILVHIWTGSGEPLPLLTGAHVRLRGLYITTYTPDKKPQSIALWVPGTNEVSIVGWLEKDERFSSIPITPLERLHAVAPETCVHISGQVISAEEGRIVVRDESGQTTVLTAQKQLPQTGTTIEAIGFPSVAGPETTLRQALWRTKTTATTSPAPTAGLKKFRLAESIMDLAPADAERAHPAQLAGVVTWSSPDAKFFFMQDASGGICVSLENTSMVPPAPGVGVIVSGVTGMGAFAPTVVASSLELYGSISMPEPRRVTLEQTITGAEEARWIEIQGLLSSIERDGSWTVLHISTATNQCIARLPLTTAFSSQVGAIVRVQGVCNALADEQRQITEIQLWVPSSEHVKIERPASADPFDAPRTSITGLRQYGQRQALDQSVRIQGTVIAHVPGNYVQIQDASAGLQAFCKQTTPLNLGDLVEVVGYPGRTGKRIVLRDALYRQLGSHRTPQPVPLVSDPGSIMKYDGRLVEVTGTLRDAIAVDSRQFLLLSQADGLDATSSITVRLDLPSARPIPQNWRIGSTVSVTGVYRVDFDEFRHRREFTIHLRTPEDLRILSAPSWWTATHTLWLTGGFLAVLVAFLTWVVALQHRLRVQTRQLSKQFEQQVRLESELERSQRLQSLGVLAGGIAHDFNNQLMVVLGNLNLARLVPQVAATASDYLDEAERGVHRARDLTQQLLTFARGGDPMKESVSIKDLAQDAASIALEGAPIQLDLQSVSSLWPVHADRRQLSRALQNIVHHARVAMPSGGTVHLRLENETVPSTTTLPLAPGRYVALRIEDTGAPIPEDQLDNLFDPYFAAKLGGKGLGLASAYSVIKRHEGHISVESRSGRGTRFSIWIPAAETLPETTATDTAKTVAVLNPPAPVAATTSIAGKRVLFMDDEPGIRRIVEILLKRIGLDPTMTTNGEECLLAYKKAQADGTPFDLVILDLLIVGGMGGKETIAELRKLDPKVRAIVSSGYSDDPILAHPADYGFCAVVPKPYEISTLSDTLRRVLQQPAA